jgi:hypothetical protein
MKQRWIKASELGEYLYCQRAWWYRLQRLNSANVQELAEGTIQHARHGRGLLRTSLQRLLAFTLVVTALALVFLQFVM